MKKYYDRVSISGRFNNIIFRFLNLKKNFISTRNTSKYIKKLSTKIIYNLPRKMGFKFLEYNGMNIYTFNGNLNLKNRRVILYLHGGSFISEANRYQLNFMKKISILTDSTLVFPVYPLSPRNNYKKCFELLDDLYEKILKNTDNIHFIGDSCGGSMAISFSMYLRDNKKMCPHNIIIISPCMDYTFTNSKINNYEKIDRCLSTTGISYVANIWSDADPNNYLVSPIYGDFNNIGLLSIFTSGCEIFNPDCHKVVSKLDKEKIKYNFYEFKNMQHNFMLFPSKESKLVINEIVNIINQ